MESQLLIYVTTGFDANDFTHETVPLSNDEFCSSYRVFEDDNSMLCVEFTLADSYIDLQNAESLEQVKAHCDVYMDSFVGISYRQAKMSESIDYFLSSVVCGQTSIYLGNIQAAEHMNFRCGTKAFTDWKTLIRISVVFAQKSHAS